MSDFFNIKKCPSVKDLDGKFTRAASEYRAYKEISQPG